MGGGVALIHKECFKVSSIQSPPLTSFEHSLFSIITGSLCFRLLVVYRPPSTEVSTFCDEFTSLLDQYNTPSLIVVGDFNIHVDRPGPDKSQFDEVLTNHRLSQHVTSATHEKGHILDLILSGVDSNIITTTKVHSLISDHWSVVCLLKTPGLNNTTVPNKVISFRNLKALDLTSLSERLKPDFTRLILNNNNLAENYASVVKDVLNDIAPIKSVTVKPRPFYSSTISESKRARRQAERKYRSSGKEDDLKTLKRLRDESVATCRTEFERAIQERLESSRNNPRKTYQILDHLLARNAPSSLPDSSSDYHLAEDFADFFSNKITLLRNGLDSLGLSGNPYQFDNYDLTSLLSHFHTVDESFVCKLVCESANKSSFVDPIPTPMVKSMTETFTPLFTAVINSSFTLGEFPDSLKLASITPILKKPGLPNILKNFRPISNLPFLAKLLERTIIAQLLDHLSTNAVFEEHQSAYRKLHSTETALLHVQNSILQSMDAKNAICLVLLDLSAAFDTVDLNILTKRLELLGVRDTALELMVSCCRDRLWNVRVGQAVSKNKPLVCGVPQGSPLGPLLYTIYTLPLGLLLRQHGVQYHMYADDTQLFLSFPRSVTEANTAVEHINSCISEVRHWMTINKLVINDSKTEVLYFGVNPPCQLETNLFHDVRVGDSTVQSSSCVRNLGVIMDGSLSFKEHISSVCKSTRFHLYRLRSIRGCLTLENRKLCVQALVTSRLDYSNSLLTGLPKKQIKRLQLIQNAAARFVMGTPMRDHITPVLRELHWLPISARIEYKILLLVHKCLHGRCPPYLQGLVSLVDHTRTLRSSNKRLLQVPYSRTNAGDRAFAHAGPVLWNTLPLHMRTIESEATFKMRLKTWLFTKNF